MRLQLRVTAAKPGVVNFELDIEKHHTVRLHPMYVYDGWLTMAEPPQHPSWGYHR